MNRKFTKKHALILSLCLLLLWGILGTGATLAWFTDSDEVTNDFYFANSEDDAEKIFSVNVWEKDAEDKIYDSFQLPSPRVASSRVLLYVQFQPIILVAGIW